MDKDFSTPSLKGIALFWLPLAATWLMMAVEQPFLSALIARLDQPSTQLAAFGVAYSLALIFESPVIMILSAVVALVRDREGYRKLFRFTMLQNLLVTAALALMALPPVFALVSERLLNLPDNILKVTHVSLIVLFPWPAAIGIRRFYQGILIVRNKTRQVAYGTVVRLLVMFSTGLLLFLLRIPGAVTGAAALSFGVVAEALAVWWMARSSSESIRNTSVSQESSGLTVATLAKFYAPLALTSFISLAVHPMATFFLSQGSHPLESLAVLPVVNSLVFVFRSLGLSFQEVVIAFIGRSRFAGRQIRRFAWYLSASVLLGMIGIAWTPLNEFWFSEVCGLEPGLVRFARLPAQILVFIPALSVLLSFQRGVLVRAKSTTAVTAASLIEVSLILMTLLLLVMRLNWVGASAAAVAYLTGRLGANLYLWPRVRRNL